MKKPYRLRKRGKVWYYKLPDETSFHSTGETNLTRAENRVLNLINSESPTRTCKLKAYAERFFIWDECPWIKEQLATGHRFSKSMAQQRRAHLVNWIFQRFGNVLLSNLNPRQIQSWLIDLPRSSQTKNHIYGTLRIILGEAKRERLINKNPMTDVKRMAKKYEERKPFSLEEIKIMFPADVAKLLEIWKSYYWASMFYLMLTSGARSGECRGLQWLHILL
jgi:integrase